MSKNFGPQYLTADGRYTYERPKYLRARGIHTPDLSDLIPQANPRQSPEPKGYKMLSEKAVERLAQALHAVINTK